MKKLVTIVIAALAGQLLAGTVTWTGNADPADGLWYTETNWDTGAVPSNADDIIISGADVVYKPGGDLSINGSLTITANGSLTQTDGNSWMQINGTITVSNGGTLSLGSCERIRSENRTGRLVIDGGTFNLASRMVEDTFTVDFLTGNAGNFIVNGEKSVDDVWSSYFSQSNFKLDGAAIASKTDFESAFSVSTADGKTTVTLNAQPGWRFATPVATAVTSSSATLSAVLRVLGEGNATVVAAYATTAEGIDLANGEEAVGTIAAGAAFTKAITGLTDATQYYFCFGVKVGGEIVAQSSIGSFYASDCSAVFMGSIDNSWSKAGNWTSGSVPTTSDTILIPAGKSCERGDGISFNNYDVTIDGGSFISRGEINPGPREVRNGGTLSATTYVNGGDNLAIIVRGSDIVSTRSNDFNLRGFYGAKPLFNFKSGAACTYTYNYNPDGEPPAFETEFNAVFKEGQIVVDGVRLTDADVDRVAISTNTEAHTVTLTLKEVAVAASFDNTSSAAVSGLTAALSVKVGVSGGKALYLLSGADPDNLTTETLVAATPQDGTTYPAALTGAEGTMTYWKFRLGASDDPEAVFDSTQPQGFYAVADGNVWYGSVSSSASVAANWSKGTVPTSSDAVHVVELVKKNALNWDIANATVASWTQIGNVTVSFQTASNSTLMVTGDVDLQGGTWTHQGSSATPDKAINVSVGGNMTIAVGASVNAGAGGDGVATASRGYSRGNGPGYLREAGGSFAGDGGHIPSANFSLVNTYGSILDPFSYGSGGWGNGDQYAGGGIVKLVVAGTLTVNGTICSRGFGWPLEDEDVIGGAGSGGTVNITAGSLAGTGRIDADGGNNGLYGPGSGGRVKVALTGANSEFSSFSGEIRAFGGSIQNQEQANLNDLTPGAAGTVCLVEGNSAPVVKVYNEWRYGDEIQTWRVATNSAAVPSATHLPARQNGDSISALKKTKWELSGHGAIRLTRDVQIASLSLSAEDGAQKVYTDGFKLTTPALVVNGSRFRSGTYTAETNPEFIVGGGSVTVGGSGLAIFVR